MFNLNDEIKNWKVQIGRQGTTTFTDLEELESHLLEEITSLRAVGLSEKESFLVASHRLGKTNDISEEFGKVNHSLLIAQKSFWLCAGAVLCILSLEFAKLLSALSALITRSQFNSGVLAGIISIAAVILIISGFMFWGFHYSEYLIKSRLFKRGKLRPIGSFIVVVLLYVAVKASNLICTTVLARTLSPQEFGHVSIMMAYSYLSLSLVVLLLLLCLAIRYRTIRNREIAV